MTPPVSLHCTGAASKLSDFIRRLTLVPTNLHPHVELPGKAMAAAYPNVPKYTRSALASSVPLMSSMCLYCAQATQARR